MMHNSGEEAEGGGRPDLLALPEDCIANIIALTSPADACNLSLVSSSVQLAAESDNVWGRFLPPDIPVSVLVNFPNFRPQSKDLYVALCQNPVLIDDDQMSFQLDKRSGKKCYMISARKHFIAGNDTSRENWWRWISDPESRFEEVCELRTICWLEMSGVLNTRLLSAKTQYKAYLVFKFTANASGFSKLPAEMQVSLVEEGPTVRPTKLMFFDSEIRNNGDQYPKERSDGWLELEMGEFFCEGSNKTVKVHCLANGPGNWKSGLIIQGIEFRPSREQ